LHDVSLYVTNQLLLSYQGAVIAASQGVPSTFAPPVRFVESDIFEAAHETRLPRYPNISGDEPYMGMSFRQGVGDSTNSDLWREPYLDLTSIGWYGAGILESRIQVTTAGRCWCTQILSCRELH
jgi:hypothetical protein